MGKIKDRYLHSLGSAANALLLKEKLDKLFFLSNGKVIESKAFYGALQGKYSILWSLLFLMIFFSSCTTDISVDLPDPEEKIVVEGYIEQDSTPYVLLTRNSPYFGGFDLNDLEQYLVYDALVTVSDGVITDTLDDVYLTGYKYISINRRIKGEFRKSYTLRVEVDGKLLTARTTIPDLLELDSLWYEEHENHENDSLVFVHTRYVDPDTLGNYIRYLSKRNSEDFYYVFVTDDRFFNGQAFSFPLRRGEDPDADFDQDTYGYFWKGDTVIIKWTAIDKTTYDFWNSVDYETNTGGPFGSATVIKSNVDGGLGILGGYALYYDTLYIPQ